MAGFDVAKLKRLEKALALVAPAGVSIFRIHNSPERRSAGPDEATIAGELYQRGEAEDEEAFHARLTVAAIAAGERRVCISLAADEGLDDYGGLGDDDPTQTIEVVTGLSAP
jgi:hypothetical protein